MRKQLYIGGINSLQRSSSEADQGHYEMPSYSLLDEDPDIPGGIEMWDTDPFGNRIM